MKDIKKLYKQKLSIEGNVIFSDEKPDN